MARISEDDYGTVRKLIEATDRLTQDVRSLYEKTKYEDLDHAVLGLQIVGHALGEVEENKGKGGRIEAVHDPKARKTADDLLRGVRKLKKEASALLKSHPNEDLETAIKALEISKGSLEEVIERYS